MSMLSKEIISLSIGFCQITHEKADELFISMNTADVRLGVNINNPLALNLYEACGYENTSQAFVMEKREV